MNIMHALHLGEDAHQASIPSLPVSCAVLCVDCERITIPYRDACPHCGGKSLLNMAHILGGTLSEVRVRPIDGRLEIACCA